METKFQIECKRKNNAITSEVFGGGPGFLKLMKDKLNVPSEFCMAQKLIKGSLEEKVYQDPSTLLLFVNRNNLTM